MDIIIIVIIIITAHNISAVRWKDTIEINGAASSLVVFDTWACANTIFIKLTRIGTCDMAKCHLYVKGFARLL
jgi:hypothetical protein